MRGAQPSHSSEGNFKYVGTPWFIEHLLCARHCAGVLHLTFPAEAQPARPCGIRDHLVQFPHLTEGETEAQREGVTCPKVSERQSLGWSLHLLTPRPRCCLPIPGAWRVRALSAQSGGAHNNEHTLKSPGR